MKWRFSEFPEYQVTKDGKVFNIKTGNRIKKVVNGRSIGFWIRGNFITMNNSRNQLEKIPLKEYSPF